MDKDGRRNARIMKRKTERTRNLEIIEKKKERIKDGRMRAQKK